MRYYSGVSETEDPESRLDRLESMLTKRERRGSRLCWIRANPDATYGYEIDDAREDIRWMALELRRLQAENAELREFAENFRKAVESELYKE